MKRSPPCLSLSKNPYPRSLSRSAFLLGLALGPVAAVLLVAAMDLGASASGWGYAVGVALTAAGLLSMPWRSRRGLTRAGVGLLLLIACLRLLTADGNQLATLRLPDESPRLINRLVAERTGPLATYFEVNSGHFAFLDRYEECQRAISQWLVERERVIHG